MPKDSVLFQSVDKLNEMVNRWQVDNTPLATAQQEACALVDSLDYGSHWKQTADKATTLQKIMAATSRRKLELYLYDSGLFRTGNRVI